MNKKFLPVIVILILLAGLYGAYRVYKHFARLAAPSATQTETASSATSLKDLITKGIAQSCTFNENGTTGTIYVSGGKVRGDFETTVNGAPTKSHIIDMDNTSYIWSDGQTVGFKTTFNPESQSPGPASSSPAAAPQGGIDVNADINYQCSAWIADSSKFNLPAGVTFSTFAMPPQNQSAPATTGSGSVPSSQCSYCDSLSGSDKTQCLIALKCN